MLFRTPANVQLETISADLRRLTLDGLTADPSKLETFTLTGRVRDEVKQEIVEGFRLVLVPSGQAFPNVITACQRGQGSYEAVSR